MTADGTPWASRSVAAECLSAWKFTLRMPASWHWRRRSRRRFDGDSGVPVSDDQTRPRSSPTRASRRSTACCSRRRASWSTHTRGRINERRDRRVLGSPSAHARTPVVVRMSRRQPQHGGSHPPLFVASPWGSSAEAVCPDDLLDAQADEGRAEEHMRVGGDQGGAALPPADREVAVGDPVQIGPGAQRRISGHTNAPSSSGSPMVSSPSASACRTSAAEVNVGRSLSGTSHVVGTGIQRPPL
jgi:hypothetical protein